VAQGDSPPTLIGTLLGIAALSFSSSIRSALEPVVLSMLNNSVVRSASLKPRTPVQRLSAANQGVVAQAGTYKVAIMGAAGGVGQGRAGARPPHQDQDVSARLGTAPLRRCQRQGRRRPPSRCCRRRGPRQRSRTRGGRPHGSGTPAPRWPARGHFSFLQSIIINCECG
jgi:hypothetical protein